jgi:hypothetical protein
LVLSASLVDFGYIRWSLNNENLNMKGKFTFEGVDFDLNNSDQVFSKISDSLSRAFKYTESKKSYITWLPTKLYASAEYFPEEYFSVGLLSYTQYYQKEFTQQLVVSGGLRVLNFLMLTANYPFFDNDFNRIGLGLSFRIFPFQFYMLTDNFPLHIAKNNGFPMIPYKLQSVNYRAGFNFVFGNNNKKKKEGDRPFIYEDVLLEK